MHPYASSACARASSASARAPCSYGQKTFCERNEQRDANMNAKINERVAHFRAQGRRKHLLSRPRCPRPARARAGRTSRTAYDSSATCPPPAAPARVTAPRFLAPARIGGGVLRANAGWRRCSQRKRGVV